MLKQRIEEDLHKAVQTLGYPSIDIVCSIPKNPAFGDYTTNIALQLAKQLSAVSHQSSEEIARKILSDLSNLSYLSHVEIAGPGFINFFFKDEVLVGNLTKYPTDAFEVTDPSVSGKKIMVEFTDPNPFKEFHIGHLFSNTIGESLSRLMQFGGGQVKRVNYYGDVGMHVAKSVWGMKEKLEKEEVTLEDLEKQTPLQRVQFLGASYALGAQAYEKDEKVAGEIKKINLLIYIVAGDYAKEVEADPVEVKEVERLYRKGKEWSLGYFETVYAILGTKFDYYYPESQVARYGIELVEAHMEDRVFEKSEGAVIFPGEKYGLHNRVFINSLGLPTYEAKELGLAVKKYMDYPYDRSIVVTGNEIKEYFQVLLTALGKIKPELAEKTTHIAHGMVRMTGGKISSRKGNVLTFDWLFSKVSEKVAALMEDTEVSQEEKKHTIDIVSIGAIKFSMLKSSPHMDVVFDLEKSVSLSGDSGPYLQYTYARLKSVLRMAQFRNLSNLGHLGNLSLEKEERVLLLKIEYFTAFIEEAVKDLRPNTIAFYLTDFAKSINLFYQKYPILKAGGKKEFRLSLTSVCAQVLKQGMFLLGIDSPERM